MRKQIGIKSRTGIIISLATAAMAGSAVSQAGPWCMNERQHMARAYSPNGPIMPQAVYGPAVMPAYRPVPGPYAGAMTTPDPRRMPVQWGNPQNTYRAAAPVPIAANTPQTGAQAGESGSESVSEDITVRINGMRFEPETVTVRPGTTVTWIHTSSMPHTISGNDDRLSSNTLYNGQTYSYTFDAKGRFDYTCAFHPSMKGSVVVETDARGT